MKRIVLFIFVALCCISLNAQELRFGVLGGYNHCAPSAYNGKPGFHVGVKGELLLEKPKGLYVDFGVNYSSQKWEQANYSYNGNLTGTTITHRFAPAYLQVPVSLGYKLSLDENVKLLVSAGPYINLGLCGKSELSKEIDGKNQTVSNTNDFYGADGLERFDYGIGARIGVELFDHIQITGGYDCGFKNTSKKMNFDNKNRNWTLTAAYVF